MTAAAWVAVTFAVAAGLALVVATAAVGWGSRPINTTAVGSAWIATFALAAGHLYRRRNGH